MIMSHPLPIYFSMFLLSLLHSPVAAPLSFRYTNFSGNDVNSDCDLESRSICLLLDATVDKNGALQLTDTHVQKSIIFTFSLGRSFYSRPLHLWNRTTGEVTNFTSNISFVLSKLDETACCGFAFYLSYHPSRLLPRSSGSYLGLVSHWESQTGASGNNSFVAVEFDTYQDSWDPSSNHLGINVNSISSVVHRDLDGHNLTAGGRGDAFISYDGEKKNLSVQLDFNGTRYALSYTVDLSSLLPEYVSVGLSSANGLYGEFNKILSWSFESTLEDGVEVIPNTGRPTNNATDGCGQIKNATASKSSEKIAVGVSVFLAALLLVAAAWLYRLSKRIMAKRVQDQDASEEFEIEGGGGPRRFAFDKLALATDQFREDWKLGFGGFGTVYRGFVADANREVAIKRISKDSKQGRKEFEAEVKIIGRLHHRNLVQLLGWCHEQDEFLLVYEFLPHGSLDRHLFGVGRRSPIPWPQRHNIVMGVASAIRYLHEEGHQCVVHRDIKSSNIMLDDALNAKLGDFGLARLANHGSVLQTTNLAGTLHYMAPEMLVTGKATKESDVYSFGVVTLEIACGRRAVEAGEGGSESLLERMWDLYGKGRVVEAADQRLGDGILVNNYSQVERVMLVGLCCAHPDPNHRPTIGKAIQALNSQALFRELGLARKMRKPTFGRDPSMSASGVADVGPS